MIFYGYSNKNPFNSEASLGWPLGIGCRVFTVHSKDSHAGYSISVNKSIFQCRLRVKRGKGAGLYYNLL